MQSFGLKQRGVLGTNFIFNDRNSMDAIEKDVPELNFNIKAIELSSNQALKAWDS